MKVIGCDKLTKFSQKYSNAETALKAWLSEVQCADWQTPQDIKNRYRSADFLGKNRVIFNIKGNHYRLVVKVKYQNGIVAIEWIGTHADYDKEKF